MNSQGYYIATLIFIIIANIICFSYFKIQKKINPDSNRNYLLPIIPLIILGLYVILPGLYYLESNTITILNDPIFKILLGLTFISLSSICIIAGIYANDSLGNNNKNEKKNNLAFTISSSISGGFGGLTILYGIFNTFIKNKKNKVLPI
jgi:NADH:ubiquinone oxidoreductase subunit 3 (subunit A)